MAAQQHKDDQMPAFFIDSVLGNLQILIDRMDEFTNLRSKWLEYYVIKDPESEKLELKVARTFILCARRLSICGWKDAGLEPFLSKHQDFVLCFAPALYALTQRELSSSSDHPDDGLTRDFNDLIRDLGTKFNLFTGEICTMYCSMRDFVVRSPSSSVSTLADKFLLEFIDSLLQNLVDVPRFFNRVPPALDTSYIEALQEKLKFLKDFILFATWQGVESSLLSDPIACLQDVAVQAAVLSQRCWFDGDLNIEDSHSFGEINYKVDHRLYEACIQCLKASKFSGGSLRTLDLEKDICIVGDFSDSLTGLLWEVLLKYDERGLAVAKQDQIQMLYDGVRFLRTILKKQPEKFNGLHQNMKDFVGSVVNEAGILILECFVSLKERSLMGRKLELEFSDLLQKIKLIKLVTSTFQSPTTNAIGFIKFLLQNLRELAELGVIAHSKDQIRTIESEFLILEAVLERIAGHHKKHERLTAFWSRVIEVANKIMLVIISFDLSPLSFHSILEELLHVKSESLEIDIDAYNTEAHKVGKASGYVSSQGFIPILNNSAVGFKDETERIINQVRHGSGKLDIVSIVGMPGLGKTTLARRVFRDPSIVKDFHIRAWCNVSQVYQMRGLLLEILGFINPEILRQCSHLDEEDLAHKLLNSLRRCRFFIILDDIWDIDVWHILKRSFPDDKNGSRILITSRLYKVASQVQVDSEPYRLRMFTDDESWDLLQKMVFRNELCPPDLCTVGKQIAQNCGGLPFTVAIVAGFLATTPQDGWKEFAERTTTTTISTIKQSMDMLELSYRQVPDYLKQCLLYVGAFQQGQAIPIKKLLLLWIAEGFVQTVEQRNMEEVAEGYMMDLVGRSLIMVPERRHIDRVERCRVHDLVHEFCVMKAREDKFFRFLHGYDGLYTFSESDNKGRLCIYSEQEHFEKSRLFCPHIRCLMFSSHDASLERRYSDCLSIFNICKLLRVLDLEQLFVRGSFPTELLVLVDLRYLAIGGKFQSIPSSIDDLSNLETFILNTELNYVALPETIWNLKNLRHLCIRGFSGKFIIRIDMHENSSILYNLSTFSFLLLLMDPSMEKILSKFPNIRTLDCELSKPEGRVLDWSMVVRMDFLSQLESLHLRFNGECAIQFLFPLNLKKLVLCKFSWSMISAIEKLSNLEELILESDQVDEIEEDILGANEEEGFSEEVEDDYPLETSDGEVRWDITEEVEFPRLKILELYNLEIVRWTGPGDHFPCLQTLIFSRCQELKEVPSCLGSNSPLETIEIRWCSPTLVSLAEEIKEEQQAMGNEDLLIIILDQ